MLGVWSVESNSNQCLLEEKELYDAIHGIPTTKSFRKDYLGYCKHLHVTPHPKLCPRLDEEDKDLLHQTYDEADVDVITIRNWMLDMPSLKLMSVALLNCTNVHTLQLINVSLTLDQLLFACGKIPTTAIKNLQFEWNTIPIPDASQDHTACFAQLLSMASSLTNVSLRGNGITPTGASAIANALKNNSKLLVLNLFRNNIQDEGAIALSNALPDNKALLHLSVANNGIATQGVLALIRSFTRYILQEDKLEYLASMENQIQAALETAKKQKKKLERNDVMKELNLPETETIDGVVYGIGNSNLQSITLSGNAMSTMEELSSINTLLEESQAKLKNHLHAVKVQRMFPRPTIPLSEFLLL